jgi:hypothetical protein
MAAVAVTPGEANRAVLDFTDPMDSKFYKMMIKPPDTKLYGKGRGVKMYMERISQYALLGGMYDIFQIRTYFPG